MGRDEFIKTLKFGVDIQSDNAIAKFRKNYEDAIEAGNTKLQAASFLSTASIKILKSAFDAFIDKFSEVVDSAIDRMGDMLKYSQMTDSSIRDLKLGYGFSSSEAYGYQTALDVLGFSDMEDLMYANEQQLSQFRDAFDKYSNYYTDLANSGYFQQLQEYQVEMKEFTVDMEHEVVEFFMNNKDVIQTFMKLSIEAAEVTITALSWILDFFSDGSRTASEKSRETQSILNTYVSSAKSTNVGITNTFNNVSQNDTTWLANAGQMTYQQIIKALT